MRNQPVLVVDDQGQQRYVGVQLGGVDQETNTVAVYNPALDQFEAVHFERVWEPSPTQGEAVLLAYGQSKVGRELTTEGSTTHGTWTN